MYPIAQTGAATIHPEFSTSQRFVPMLERAMAPRLSVLMQTAIVYIGYIPSTSFLDPEAPETIQEPRKL